MLSTPERLRDELIKFCEPVLEEKGFELVDLDVVVGKKRFILRFFIDRLDQVGGVTIKDCVHMSRELEDVLDFEDFITQPYVLEVSSPGVDRPLVKERDFDRFAGNKVNINTTTSIEGRHRYTGILRGIKNHLVILEDEKDGELRIPHSSIKKAHIKYEWK